MHGTHMCTPAHTHTHAHAHTREASPRGRAGSPAALAPVSAGPPIAMETGLRSGAPDRPSPRWGQRPSARLSARALKIEAPRMKTGAGEIWKSFRTRIRKEPAAGRPPPHGPSPPRPQGAGEGPAGSRRPGNQPPGKGGEAPPGPRARGFTIAGVHRQSLWKACHGPLHSAKKR